MQEVRNNNIDLSKTPNQYNKDFQLDATIASILNFTAYIKTNKRIDNLSKEKTINLLKECKENIEEKTKYKNYYEYNDIGYMIVRQIIKNFLNKLDKLIETIDKENITYKNYENKDNTTGGKITEEYITPDRKGREIPFPGHTGLYSNIEGLLNLFYKLVHTEELLTNKEKQILWTQPYQSPYRYNQDNTLKLDKYNTPRYTFKTAGIFFDRGKVVAYNQQRWQEEPTNKGSGRLR